MDNESQAAPPCAGTLRKLADGDLTDWSGLPEGCGPDELAAVFSGGEQEGWGLLSRNRVRFRVYEAAAQQYPLQAWFDDNNHVFLITISAPHIAGGADDLLRRLGEPEATLEPGTGVHASARQWIYASRGLTLFVDEDTQEILRLAAYLPSRVSFYTKYLGATDRKRYFPE